MSEQLDVEDSERFGSSSCSPSNIPDEMEYIQIQFQPEESEPSMINYYQAGDQSSIAEANTS